MYKTFFIAVISLFFGGCASLKISTPNSPSQWSLVYENDQDGETLSGSKQDLLDAIRLGQPVRIVTIGRRVEHAADAGFLTIFGGEAFAQIQPIEAQRPTQQPPRMEYRASGTKWRMIVGTNGTVTALMDGQDQNARTGRTRWFVQVTQ